jgi:hypothetical protein
MAYLASLIECEWHLHVPSWIVLALNSSILIAFGHLKYHVFLGNYLKYHVGILSTLLNWFFIFKRFMWGFLLFCYQCHTLCIIALIRCLLIREEGCWWQQKNWISPLTESKRVEELFWILKILVCQFFRTFIKKAITATCSYHCIYTILIVIKLKREYCPRLGMEIEYWVE